MRTGVRYSNRRYNASAHAAHQPVCIFLEIPAKGLREIRDGKLDCPMDHNRQEEFQPVWVQAIGSRR